jgi:hypothetical protein
VLPHVFHPEPWSIRVKNQMPLFLDVCGRIGATEG